MKFKDWITYHLITLQKTGKHLPSIQFCQVKHAKAHCNGKKAKPRPLTSKQGLCSSWKNSPYLQSAINSNGVKFRPYSCHEKNRLVLKNAPIHSPARKKSPKARPSANQKIVVNNQQLTLCPYFQNGRHIYWLGLKGNQISVIANLSHLCNLTVIDISDNHLTSLCGLDDLVSLSVLMVGQNRIRKIDHLEKLTKLTIVDFHSNEISAIDGLGHLPRLRILNLSYNLLSAVDFGGFSKSLAEINISHNNISQIKNIDNLGGVEILDASHNLISSFGNVEDVLRCANLKKLSLHNNPIWKAPVYEQILLHSFPRLVTLDSNNTGEMGLTTKVAHYKRKKLDRQIVARNHLVADKTLASCQEMENKFPSLCQDDDDERASLAFKFSDVGEEIGSIHNRLFEMTTDDKPKFPIVQSQHNSSQVAESKSLQSKSFVSIEIENNVLNLCGHESIEKCLNRNWKTRTLSSVDGIKFSHVQFKHISRHLAALLRKFSSVANLRFIHTNIHSLYQLNVFGTIGPIKTIDIDEAGNSVPSVPLWRPYLLYRTAHVGLLAINDKYITKQEIVDADERFCCLATMAYSQLPLYRLSSLLVDPVCQYEFASGTDEVKTSLQKDNASTTGKEHHSISKAVLMYHHHDHGETRVWRQRERLVGSFVDRCLRKSADVKARQGNLNQVLDDILLQTITSAIDDYSDLVNYMKNGYLEMFNDQTKQELNHS